MPYTTNYGLLGGFLNYEAPSPLARLLTSESIRRGDFGHLTTVEAQLYMELGIDQAELHANWGV